MGISENIMVVRANIAKAAAKSGRALEDIALLAATKNASVEQVNEAISSGITMIGESRTDSAAEKFPKLETGGKKVERHMIGHLQTNKVKDAVRLFDVIQSVDSLRLAKEIDKHAKNSGKVMPIMIEVNISGEGQKFGIPEDDVDMFYHDLLKLGNIKMVGLMAIAPYLPAEETRPYFRRMKKLFDRLGLRWLSVGMTNDYAAAVEEGSNMVRIGTDLFSQDKL